MYLSEIHKVVKKMPGMLPLKSVSGGPFFGLFADLCDGDAVVRGGAGELPTRFYNR